MTRLPDFAPLPHLADLSQTWPSVLVGHAGILAQYGPMSLAEAMNQPLSMIGLFDEHLLKHRIEQKEAQDQLLIAQIKAIHAIPAYIAALVRR